MAFRAGFRSSRCSGAVTWPVLALGLATACGPSTLWYGHSPDRRHRVAIIDDGDGQVVYLDGRAVARHDAVGFAAIRVADGGARLAYPAKEGPFWHVVVDGRSGPAWQGIGDVRLSADGRNVVYTAEREEGWYVATGGHAMGPFGAIVDGTFAITPDGKATAFAAARGGRLYVVEGALEHGPFDDVSSVELLPSRRPVFVARVGRAAFVQVGGLRGEAYDEVTLLTRSVTGDRVGYVGRRGDGSRVVVGNAVEGPHEAVGQVALGPGSTDRAYTILRAGRWSVVRGGVHDPDHDEITPRSLTYGPRGKRVVYVARDGAKVRVVIDGVEGPPFTSVETPVFDEEDTRTGYVGSTSKGSAIVVSGRVLRREPWATSLTFTPDGRSFAYIAPRGNTSAVVVHGKAFPFSFVLADSIVFDSTGSHWACLVGNRRTEELYITVDGRERRPFDLEELVAGEMQKLVRRGGGDDPTVTIRRWIRAELELALAPWWTEPRRAPRSLAAPPLALSARSGTRRSRRAEP